MFKSARWRSDKNKIKGVFKLQFHATQLGQLGGDALMISVIPADVGKPTSRLEKAKLQDGSCYWEKPLYETMKFSQDPKTGKFHEKIYYFVVAKDSSRFGGVGEVSIDFASYAEATKLTSLSLPLKNANSVSVLHVSIQKVQGSPDQSLDISRDFDVSANASPHDRSLRTHFINNILEGSIRRNPTEDHGTVNGINRDHPASIGSDIMLSSSDGSSGLNTPREHEPINTKPIRAFSVKHDRPLQWDWLNGSAPNLSTDDSSTSTLGETSEEGSSDAMIQKLKAEVAALTRQADVSELELQTLRKQIVKEVKKGQDLSREVATLKEERNALKEECEKLNAHQNCEEEEEVKVNGMLLIDEGDPWALLDELRYDLSREKDTSSNLRLELQKTRESNAELARALETSKSKSKSKLKSTCLNDCQSRVVVSKSDMDDDEEQKELEAIVREHSGVKETHLLEQKIVDLYSEIELYKRDKDELEVQMEQIALDYEILKQENHEMFDKLERSQLQEQLKIQYECNTSFTTLNELESQIENLENELKLKSKGLSEMILSKNDLESHVKNLEEELENQARVFEADLEDLIHVKTEMEQRAIHAEDNLRKMKLQNANTASRLQEELRRLSQKMEVTFEGNEKAAMKAVDEANKLRVEKRFLEDTLIRVKEELRNLDDRFQEKLVDLLDQITLKSKHMEKIRKQIEDVTSELKHQKRTRKYETELLNAKMQNLEDEMSQELVTDGTDIFLLHKEKVLQVEIEEFERKLDNLVQKTEKSQVATTEDSNLTLKSDEVKLSKMSETEYQEEFDIISKNMALLKKSNQPMRLLQI